MKTQWEYDLVERPFCEQLKTMGWQWIEGDKDADAGCVPMRARPGASGGSPSVDKS